MAQVDNQLVQARSTLLDALEALGPHRNAIILVGAQAIYMHTGSAEIALAEFTTDADLALDTRSLVDDPRVESAMILRGFVHPPGRNPGVWMSPQGVQVDLMVPALIAGKGRRSVSAPPHDPRAMRRSYGLEAALIDHEIREVIALAEGDPRRFAVRVAGPAALLVAKVHKLQERLHEGRSVENKDAHDIYRLLVAVDSAYLAGRFRMLQVDEVSSAVSISAVHHLRELFRSDRSDGARMAGEAERNIGDPEQVSLASSLLANDFLDALESGATAS